LQNEEQIGEIVHLGQIEKLLSRGDLVKEEVTTQVGKDGSVQGARVCTRCLKKTAPPKMVGKLDVPRSRDKADVAHETIQSARCRCSLVLTNWERFVIT
jgi:hypothetical protein